MDLLPNVSKHRLQLYVLKICPHFNMNKPKHLSTSSIFSCSVVVGYSFKAFRILSPTPLQWNRESNEFSVPVKSSKKYWKWLLQIFGVVGFLTFTSCLYTIYHCDGDIVQNMVCMMLLMVSAFDCAFAKTLVAASDDIVVAINALKYASKKYCHRDLVEQCKYLGLASKVIVGQGVLVCIFAPFVLTWEDLDPFYAISKTLQLEQTLGAVTAKLLRLTLQILCFMEVARIYAIFASVFFLWLEMISKYMHTYLAKPEISTQQFIRNYQACKLFVKIGILFYQNG